MTLRELIDTYIVPSDAVLSPTTIAGYHKIKRVAFADILDNELNMLTNERLKQAVNNEAKRPSQKYKNEFHPISPKTVSNEYGLTARNATQKNKGLSGN